MIVGTFSMLVCIWELVLFALLTLFFPSEGPEIHCDLSEEVDRTRSGS